MKLNSLQEFICDTCGEKINSIEDGYVEFMKDAASQELNEFHIVHNKPSSPLEGDGKCFQHENEPGRRDLPLSHFFGQDSLNRIYSFLDAGVFIYPNNDGPRIGNIREYVDFMRRLTIPNYEEARQYMQDAEEDNLFDGANETGIYSQRKLLEIIDRYST